MAKTTTGAALGLGLAIVALATACDPPPPSTAPLDLPSTSAPEAAAGSDADSADGLGSGPGGEGPPPPPAGAFLAQMTPEQTAQLTQLGVEVVVPGQVPPAFSVAEMRVSQSDPAPSYLVVYQDEADQCFAMEFAAEGFGDLPATENRLSIKPPLFGDQSYGLNYGPFVDADLSAQAPQANLFTDWMIGSSGAYRLVGAAYIGDLFDQLRSCTDISPEAAVALAESLTVLSTDPMGAPVDGP
ncbi:MAG TPA: hypothetical protein VLS96_02625 [Nodosilinea sp.]|nr:hypothetical protein [Nodosilinea sp.]